jgi:hypothetical protein
VLAGLIQDSLWLYSAGKAADLAAAAHQLASHMFSQDNEGGPDAPGAHMYRMRECHAKFCTRACPAVVARTLKCSQIVTAFILW